MQFISLIIYYIHRTLQIRHGQKNWAPHMIIGMVYGIKINDPCYPSSHYIDCVLILVWIPRLFVYDCSDISQNGTLFSDILLRDVQLDPQLTRSTYVQGHWNAIHENKGYNWQSFYTSDITHTRCGFPPYYQLYVNVSLEESTSAALTKSNCYTLTTLWQIIYIF